MMKSCETVIIVDVVEEAVKFYTEKLGFDITDLLIDKKNEQRLQVANLRKGKCFIKFRIPLIEELADFSFIKRCANRCVAIQVHVNSGLEKHFARCKKKGVKIVSEPADCESTGMRMFSVRDPFGVNVVFVQPQQEPPAKNYTSSVCGIHVDKVKASDPQTFDYLVRHLNSFGILRRPAKKFAKFKIKEILKK